MKRRKRVGSLRDYIDSDRREEYWDFANRYDEGAPHEGISDEEVINRHREVAPNLSEVDYQLSAHDTFARMSSEERVEFGWELRDQAAQRGLDFPGRSAEGERFDDPNFLARVTARAHHEHPDHLESLLKSGGSGFVGGAMGDGVTGGEGAYSGEGGMTSNPAAKAALTGIVATAVKRAMDR